MDLAGERANRPAGLGALRWLVPLGVALAAVAAFGPALGAELVSYDDPENLTANQGFRGLGTPQLAWMLRTGWMGHYQPLSWLSFAIDYARGGQGQDGVLDPAPFHATNVLLHALAALAVYTLARRLVAPPGERGSARALLAAAFAALVFAVHPLRAESVAWVTERRDVLSAPFFVLAVVAWLGWGRSAPAANLRPRRLAAGAVAAAVAIGLFVVAVDRGRPGALSWGPLGPAGLAMAFVAWGASLGLVARAAAPAPSWRLVLCALLLLASLLAKAWGIVMPALLLVLDAWPLRRGRRARGWGLLVLEKVPFVVPSVVFGLLASWAQASQIDTMKTWGEHTLAERAAQGLYGLGFYPWRTLVPLGLAPIYDLPQQLSLAQARFALPALGVIAVSAALIALRRRWPAALAAWVAYAVVVSPVLGLAQSGPQLVADRYSYLACIPFALLLGCGLERTLALRPRLAAPLLATAAVVVLILGAATRAQARVWRDSPSLWEHALRVQPDSPMAHLSLGAVRFSQAGQERDPARKRAVLEEARALLERGLELEPLPRMYANLALIEGTLAELEPERAEAHRRSALVLSAKALELARSRGGVEAELQLNHAMHLYNAGRVDEALPLFERYVRRRPESALGRLRYGIALLGAHRPAAAARQLEAALALEPSNELARDLLRDARAQALGSAPR